MALLGLVCIHGPLATMATRGILAGRWGRYWEDGGLGANVNVLSGISTSKASHTRPGWSRLAGNVNGPCFATPVRTLPSAPTHPRFQGVRGMGSGRCARKMSPCVTGLVTPKFSVKKS